MLVTVTVEGSPGPVRALVGLRESVGEAIRAVAEAYCREGRSPKLDPATVVSFQLHRTQFCLESTPDLPFLCYFAPFGEEE